MPEWKDRARVALRRVKPVRWAYRGTYRQIQYLRYVTEYFKFKRLSARGISRFPVAWSKRHAVFGEWTASHGFDRHYVFHLAWAARILASIKPEYHVDVSSSLHFCTIVSAFIPVRYYEFRALEFDLTGMSCGSADLLALPFEDESVPSLSCMHVVEHLGLGRYGDPLDPEADIKAIGELKRVLAVGGSLLFVVPTGRPRLAFNAQRVYSYAQTLGLFAGLSLEEFALIPDSPEDGGLLLAADQELADRQENGCGCYWFVKREGSQVLA